MRIISRTDLNGDTPLRVQPGIGEWGGEQVVSRRRRRWMKVIVPVVFVLITCGLIVLGAHFFGEVRGYQG